MSIVSPETGASKAFNARWLTDSEVAEKFVPVPAFQTLVGTNNSVLLGPRGSGKTTLLRMLTRPALESWSQLARVRGVEFQGVDLPAFEAIYLPSDTRWSIELVALGDDPIISATGAEAIQRMLVAISALQSVTRALEVLCKGKLSLERELVQELLAALPLRSRPATFRQFSTALRMEANVVRGVVNRRSVDEIASLVREIPNAWLGHVLDLPIICCEIISGLMGDVVRGNRWAFCVDEVEIAPEWLKEELIHACRSVDQPFLVKVTWSPVLRSEYLEHVEPDQDFKPILLWHSYAHEARGFADQLAKRFMERTFRVADSPEALFGHSHLHDEGNVGPSTGKYDRDSAEYRDNRELATIDETFKQALSSYGIDPKDPFTDDPSIRDSFLRKVRPVVLVRLAYLSVGGKRRTRRRVPELYSGVEVIYDVCEGNPRWLLGLLSDLYDQWRLEGAPEMLSRAAQAKAIQGFAQRFRDELTAKVVSAPQSGERRGWTLGGLVDRIGTAIAGTLWRGDFQVDPVSAFTVDSGQSGDIHSIIEAGLDMGAFVYLGGMTEGMPTDIKDAKLRVSYRLAPWYGMATRLFRDVSLTALLDKQADPWQTALFEEPEE